MNEPFILCDGLVKIFQVAGLEVLALQGLNLSVRQGELMGIIGGTAGAEVQDRQRRQR